MTTRDTILKRIRAALADVESVELPPIGPTWPPTDPSVDTMRETFIEQLTQVHGETIPCDTVTTAAERLAELVGEKGWTAVGAFDDPLCRAATADIPGEGIVKFVGDDPSSDEMGTLDAGVISATWLLANTGSCGVVCRTREERMLCYIPPVSVVLARESSIRETMSAAWDEVVADANEGGRTGETVLITGPSRTADIEKRLVLGVHGPRRVIVLLIRGKG